MNWVKNKLRFSVSGSGGLRDKSLYCVCLRKSMLAQHVYTPHASRHKHITVCLRLDTVWLIGSEMCWGIDGCCLGSRGQMVEETNLWLQKYGFYPGYFLDADTGWLMLNFWLFPVFLCATGLFKGSVSRPVDGGDDLQPGRLQTLL